MNEKEFKLKIIPPYIGEGIRDYNEYVKNELNKHIEEVLDHLTLISGGGVK